MLPYYSITHLVDFYSAALLSNRFRNLLVLKSLQYLTDENVTGVLPHCAIICKFITTTCSLFVAVHLSGLFGEKEARRLYDQIQRKQLERKGQCKVELAIANVDQKDAVQVIFKVTVSGSQDRTRRSSSARGTPAVLEFAAPRYAVGVNQTAPYRSSTT